MKTLLTCLSVALLLFSCDPNANKQVGNANRFNTNPTNGGGSGSGGGAVGSGTNSTTDVPIDGGLGILLIAGAAYGVKRAKSLKQKE